MQWFISSLDSSSIINITNVYSYNKESVDDTGFSVKWQVKCFLYALLLDFVRMPLINLG